MRVGRASRGLIVVVDDFVDAADGLALLLGAEGYEVAVAYGGPSGLRLIEDLQPHTAIIDLAMPGMDGFQVAGAIRLTQWGADMRLIALTGLDIAGDDDVGVKRCGFDHVMIKPAEADELMAVLLQSRPVRLTVRRY